MMKNIWIYLIIVAILGFSGCVTSETGKNYSALAREKSFDYFFTAPDAYLYFDDLDEAYDHISTAQAKFSQSSGKSRAQGLAAKLKGPTMTGKQPVTVVYFIRAANREAIDLWNSDKPIEVEVKNAISASLVFAVFYGDRGVSMSNFYLKSGYQFNSNSQIPYFTLDGVRYETEYPVGWGSAKAFAYLRGELD